MFGTCQVHTHDTSQVLASRIEDALERNLPLDGLTSNKAELPPHMQCDAGLPAAVLSHSAPHSASTAYVCCNELLSLAWVSCQSARCWRRPKPETLKRRQEERKAAAAGNRGVRGSARISKVSCIRVNGNATIQSEFSRVLQLSRAPGQLLILFAGAPRC